MIKNSLGSGIDVLSELGSIINSKPSGRATVKKLVYAMTFGQLEVNFKKTLYKEFSANEGSLLTNDQVTNVLSHPFLKELVEKRSAALSQIISQSNIADCFGRKMEASTKSEARSVASIVVQSLELKLLLPVLDAAREEMNREGRTRWRITLWQHDGFSVSHDQHMQPEHLIGMLTELVADGASTLDIPTTLICKSHDHLII